MDSQKRTRWKLYLGIVAVALLGTALALLWQSAYPDLYQLRVQVLEPDGRPVAGATVRTSAGNEPHLLPDGWWEIQIPDVKVPQDRKISIWAEHPRWEANRAELLLEKDENPRAEIRLQRPESWFRGRVVDEDNNVLRGVKISRQDGLPGTTLTRNDGTFELKLPVPNEERIQLRAELPGWAPDSTMCYAGRDSCPMVLSKR